MEVSPTAKPPVCRVMDFGKYKYEQAKKQQSARVHQRSMQLKEIKLRPYTDTHDLEVKIRNVRRFLEDKNKAKITVSFRGRERAHTEIGRPLMEAIWEGVKDIGMIDAPTKMEGDNMIMIVSPKAEILKAKKPHNPAAPAGLSDVKADVRADVKADVRAEVKASGEENIIIEGRENEQDKT